MAYTNKTANYELPQYVPTDKPTYLEDFNGAMFTIDSGMKQNSNNIGDLSTLTTTAKSSLVSAVNEVNANSGVALIGDLSTLTTTEKSTVVGAINEVDYNTDTNTTAIGDLSSLTTTDKSNLVSAINEVVSSSGGGSTPTMIYLGKINAYNSTSNALDLSSYVAGTRIVLKHNDSSRSFYIKVGSNTAQVQVTTDDNTAIVNNIYYVDINSISGSTASISITWASTYEWCPLVTNNIKVNFTQASATVGNTTRSMQVFPYFQLEENSSGKLNTTTLQDFVSISSATFSKQRAPQKTAIHYIDKDKNSCLLSFTSMISGSQRVYEGIMTTKQPNTNGFYETYKIRLELNYSNGVYQSHVLNKTKIGVVFDATAISGYSTTGTKQLQLNNGALEWV